MKKIRRVILIVLCVLPAGTGSYGFPRPADVSDLHEIAFVKSGAAVEVSVLIRGEFGNDVFRLTKPERLVFDISPINTLSAAPQTEIHWGGILRVRTGKFNTEVARLVFDLETAAVNYKIDRTDAGLKITFWKEGAEVLFPDKKTEVKPAGKPSEAKVEVKPAAKPESKAEAKPEAKLEPEIEPEPEVEPAALPIKDKRGFFAQIGGGVGTFLKSTATLDKFFPLYSEQGERTEAYKLKLNTPSFLSAGGYIKALDVPVKLGLAIEYWNFKSDGAFEFAVPHPFLSDSPRMLALTGQFRNYFTSVSVFGLFQVFSNGRLMMFAGPEIGYAFGKYKFLDKVEFNDQPPFMADDVKITSITYLEKSISSLWAGVQASFEYSFSRSFSLLLNLRALYLNPEIKELSSTFNLSQAHAQIGFQINF
jgi:hypothetical protein